MKRRLGLFLAIPALLLCPASPRAAAAPTAPTACPTSLSYGGTFGCALDVVGEVDSFGLSATAGDRVLLHAVGATGSGLDVDLEMRDASGTTICAARAGSSAEAICPVTTTARHTVSVFDSGSDEAGTYKLSAQRINRPVGAFTMVMGRPRHGVVTTTGEDDWYTFAGVANMVAVTRAAVLAAAPLDVDFDVFGPTGDTICSARAGSSATTTCTLPSTGTYTLRVNDSSDDETGAYALTVRPDCTLLGTSGADTLTGTSGADVICGGGGADKIAGGDGDDIIIGGTSDDVVDGGAGNDVFLSERTADGADTVTGGTGNDVLSYAERSAPVGVDADVQADDGESGEGDDVRADVETLVGGAGNDRLFGSSLNNTLSGGPGDDVLDGSSGDDTFLSAPDPDGADTFVGGTGRDHVSWAERATTVTADPDGLADDGAPGERDLVGTDVEVLTSGAGNDALTGGPGANELTGGSGDDTLDGGLGADRLSGGAGVDSFIVRAGDGADVMVGGTASDSVSYAGRSAAVAVRLDGVANDGESGEGDDVRADVENVTGGNAGDTIVGSASANRLDGGPGADTVSGSGGDDTLLGGPGFDSLDGGDGIDRCDPGADGARVERCDRT